ncbi:MAG: ankyrin repeat domain-containing protein [Pyrinomonadaceae bacterium]|nr:ankyrin repeat domain-containing protein [Pyrinomonadaceae bacterium]MBP6212061.1 ankyrin repeat domain-containing protein [Pyrinomonadaceae bacterium]
MDIFARIMVRDVDSYQRLIESTPIEAKDENGASLLRIAIAYGSEPIALDLVDRGIEIEQLDRKGKNEIQNSFYKGLWELGRRLIDRGANLEHFDWYGNNALWYAVTHPRPDYELLKLLVKAGSDVQTKNRAGRSPRDAARVIGDSKMIEILETGL